MPHTQSRCRRSSNPQWPSYWRSTVTDNGRGDHDNASSSWLCSRRAPWRVLPHLSLLVGKRNVAGEERVGAGRAGSSAKIGRAEVESRSFSRFG